MVENKPRKTRKKSRIPGVSVGDEVKTSVGEKKRFASTSGENGFSGWWILTGGRREDPRRGRDVRGRDVGIRDEGETKSWEH